VHDPSCRLTIMATAHMAVRTETFPHSTSIPHSESMGARIIPIPTPTIKMSPPSNGDPMEITSPAPSSNGNHNSDSETNGKSNDRPKNSPAPDSHGSNNHANNSNSMPAPPPAAAAIHQPKIVQTAFIHKLYKWDCAVESPRENFANYALACSRTPISNT
jgi:hypothetical protein